MVLVYKYLGFLVLLVIVLLNNGKVVCLFFWCILESVNWKYKFVVLLLIFSFCFSIFFILNLLFCCW